MRQTGLPMTALSALVGPLRLPMHEKAKYVRQYVPWANRSASRAIFMMNVFYEHHFEEPLHELRAHWAIEPWIEPSL